MYEQTYFIQIKVGLSPFKKKILFASMKVL